MDILYQCHVTSTYLLEVVISNDCQYLIKLYFIIRKTEQNITLERIQTILQVIVNLVFIVLSTKALTE